MKQVELYVPALKDLWYRQKCMSDAKTMAYNAGYNVSYEGYHYDTGCIDFPDEAQERWYEEKMGNPNFFYAYIRDVETGKFVGYLNFNKTLDDKATMGIVISAKYRGMGYMRPSMELLIQKARENGVKVLADSVPASREVALKVFFDLGFVKRGEYQGVKFGEPETVYEIEKYL